MGVGLAVVREAVQRLTALNVLEATHGSGTVVQPFRWIPLIFDPSLFDLAVRRIGVEDLWEARRLLEGQIIRLAAERATKVNLEAIRAVLELADPLPLGYDDSKRLNHEFHLAIARAAQNQVLEDLVTPLLDVHVEGAGNRFTPEISKRTWSAHWAMYDAVVAGDVAAADRAIQAHFEIGPLALIAIEARSRSALGGGRKAASAKKT